MLCRMVRFEVRTIYIGGIQLTKNIINIPKLAKVKKLICIFGVICVLVSGCGSTGLCPSETLYVPDLEFPGRLILVPEGFFNREDRPFLTEEEYLGILREVERESGGI